MSDIVFLNVGGVVYVTHRDTLLESNSFFSGLVRSDPTCSEFFIDRDPTHFRYVLNWMRGVKFLPEDRSVLTELSWEADYYSIPDLREALARAHSYSIPSTLAAIHAELRQQ